MSNSTKVQIPRLTRETQPDAMQISDCVVPIGSDSPSPVEQFENALAALARMSSEISAHSHPEVLGEMIIVSAVASVEAFFRDLLSELVMACPLVRENLRGEHITVGAATSYPEGMVGLALVERELFSSKGVIEKQLRRFMKLDLKGQQELKAAISAYERACTCRHAAAHWRGYVDSATLAELGVDGAMKTRYQIRTTYELVQRVLAACDHLVHTANEVLLDLTVNRWVKANLISLTDDAVADDTEMCERLMKVFASAGASAISDGATLRSSLVAES